jgi:hypothetical protein
MELSPIHEHLHAVGEAANALRLDRAAGAASGASRLPCRRLDRSELGVVGLDWTRPPGEWTSGTGARGDVVGTGGTTATTGVSRSTWRRSRRNFPWLITVSVRAAARAVAGRRSSCSCAGPDRRLTRPSA